MSESLEDIRPGSRKLVAEAQAEAQRFGRTGDLAVRDWLAAFLSRNRGMLEDVASASDIETLAVNESPLAVDLVLEKARANARARGAEAASERDLMVAVVETVGCEPRAAAASPEGTSAAAATTSAVGELGDDLLRYGRDLTASATSEVRSLISGRDKEIDLIVETLCRTEKRNPILVGPAGTGKTAIVEGLAQRVAAGMVPEFLTGVHIIALELTALVGGSSYVGEFEKRAQAVIEQASRPDVILFIDEAHGLTSVGGRTDLGNILKPALARGEIAVIAATTDEEYRQSVEKDAALARRFQKVQVAELDRAATHIIVAARAQVLSKMREVEVPDEIVSWIVDFADRNIRNRAFPDKAIDVLEQVVGHAVARSDAVVTMDNAEEVAGRFAGIPKEPDEAIDALRAIFADNELLEPEDSARLLSKAEASLRGFDFRSERADLALLLVGPVSTAGRLIAADIADAVFGDPRRVVRIDLSRMTEQYSLSMLIGSSAGYVGYDDRLEIQRISEVPWSVLLLEGLDSCHRNVQSVCAAALRDGFMTDARGIRHNLSNAIVVCTAPATNVELQGKFGFNSASDADSAARAIASTAVGDTVAELFDVVIAGGQVSATSRPAVVSETLGELRERFASRGATVVWDESVAAWLADQAPRDSDGLERYADVNLVGPVAALVEAALKDGSGTLTISRDDDGKLRVTG